MVLANVALGPDCYVPILKCKQGELGALAWATGQDRTRLVPLVEVRDGVRQASAFAAAWNDPMSVAFVHPLNIDDADEAAWEGVVQDVFDTLRTAGQSVLPVVTTDDPAGLVTVIAAVCALDSRGAVVRLDAESVALAPPAALAVEVAHLLAGLGLSEAECDLVVDVGLVRDSAVARVTTAEAALRAVPAIADWRSVVVAFSAFPESIGDLVAPSSVGQLLREDAQAFATLIARGPARDLVYSDFAIGTPFYADIPWAPIPAIRYAADAYWFVHRGATKANRSPQYVALAADIVHAGHYAGATASGGDRYLSDVATGHDGPGNPTTYVRCGTSRHLACVLDRLATLGVP